MNTAITDIPNITDCGCPDETQKPLNESDASKDSCGDLATYPEPCPKGLMDLYCTKFTGSADPVFSVAPGDRGSTVLVKIMNKIKELHGLGVPATLLPVNNIILSNITSTTVDFSWAVVAGATKYDIRYRKVPSQAWQYVNDITPVNVQLTNLASDSIYQYGLRARDAGTNYSDWSLIATFRTLVALAQLPTPTGMVVSSTSPPYTVTIGWSAVLGATSYEVRIEDTSVPGSLMIVPNIVGNSGIVIPIPTLGTGYTFQVIAKASGYRDSELSSQAIATVKIGPPASVDVTSIGQTSAIVTWPIIPPTGAGVPTYKVEIIHIASGSITATLPTASLSQAVSGLLANTAYEARVYGINGHGQSLTYVTKSFVTLP